MIVTTKRCSKCEQAKPVGEFARAPQTKDRLYAWCRACCREYARKRYTDNPEHYRALTRNYYEDHPGYAESVRATSRARYTANPGRSSTANRVWRASHTERVKAVSRAYYIANPDRIKARAREWAAKYPERVNARVRRWKRANKELVAAAARLRRMRRHGVEHDLTVGEWKILKDEFGHRCAYCGTKPFRLTQDHVKSVTQGGPHTYENIVPSCQPCNSSKGIKTLEQFMATGSSSECAGSGNSYRHTQYPTINQGRENQVA